MTRDSVTLGLLYDRIFCFAFAYRVLHGLRFRSRDFLRWCFSSAFEGGGSGVGLTTRGERLFARGLASAGFWMSDLAASGSSELDGT